MNYFKRLLQKKNKKFVFTTRNLANRTSNGELINSEPFFTVDDALQGWTINSTNGVTTATAPSVSDSVTKTSKKDERKAVEPKAVFDEIKKETPEISFEKLPEKIKAVEERIKILKEHLDDSHLKDEHQTLFYLKNRLKYLKTRKRNPLDWAVTNRDAVTDLCKRYKLKVVPLKQYYTLVPKEGIKEMDRYTKAYKAITKDNPIFELVIKDSEPASPEAKQQRRKDRDPILLANSPLSNAIFVLGAWDDEVEIVDEIIYGMK